MQKQRWERAGMAHVVDAKMEEEDAMEVDTIAAAAAAAAAVVAESDSGPDLTCISGSGALVSPGEREYDLLTARLRALVEDGRGECIFDVGVPVRGGGGVKGEVCRAGGGCDICLGSSQHDEEKPGTKLK